MGYYDVLEISSRASQEVIRMAYKALIRKYHPDTYQGDKKFAEDKTIKIIEAYEILSDPVKKKKYDLLMGIDKSPDCHYQAENKETREKKPEDKKPEDKKPEDKKEHSNCSQYEAYVFSQPLSINKEIKQPIGKRSSRGLALVAVIIIAVVTVVLISSYVSGKKEARFEQYVSEGDKYFSEHRFDLAAKSYKSAFNTQHDEYVKKQYYLSIALAQSNNYFQQAEHEYNRDELEESLTFYRQVIPEDANYAKSQEMISMITEIIANNYFDQAKNFYLKKDYTSAYNQLTNVLLYQPDHEAKKLLADYKDKRDKQIEKERLAAEKERKKISIQLGKTRDDVKKIIGSPNRIEDYSFSSEWYYGSGYDASMISFDERGRVTGWDQISVDLKVFQGDKLDNAKPFRLGSTYDDVVKAVGTPNKIVHYSFSSEWYYGTGYDASMVSFDERGRVTGWDQKSIDLKVSLGEKLDNAKPFKLGSTYEDVVKAMGTPNKIVHYSFSSEWYYGSGYDASMINFDERGRVTGWDEKSVKLNFQ